MILQVILQCCFMNMHPAIVWYGNALFTNNDNIHVCCEFHKILSLYKVQRVLVFPFLSYMNMLVSSVLKCIV